MTRDELVERMARALWENWRLHCETCKPEHRDIDWDMLQRGAKTRPLIAEVVADAHRQATAALTELEKHVPDFAKLLDGWVAVPEIPPFPKMFKVRGEHADTNSGKLERKTVWLGWTDESGGWYQWGSEGSAKLFATEKSARDAAKGNHGPWYNTPAQETIEVVEAESRKAKDYRAAIAARPR